MSPALRWVGVDDEGGTVFLAPHCGGIPLRIIVFEFDSEEVIGGVLNIRAQLIVARDEGKAKVLIG